MSTTLVKSLTTKEEIAEIIKTDYSDKSFDQLSDLQAEITDTVMPIYTSDIIGEWQAMPSEYDNEGAAQYGLPPEKEITITRLMELDLYAYYSDLVSSLIWELTDNGDTVEESEANK